MACALNRENVTVSIIQYASDQLEDTGLFTNTGGNTLNVNGGFLTLEGDIVEGTPIINGVDGIETIHIKTEDGLELVRRPKYQEVVDGVNREFGESLVGYDEDTNTATIWPSDELVDSYLPEQEILPEHQQAIQSINEQLGVEALSIEDNEVVINDVKTELPQPSKRGLPQNENRTKAWVKDFLTKMGVDNLKVNDIVINGERMGANAVALPLQSLVLHTQDGEVNLTEEAMHIAVEIISQRNPELFQEMMDEVENTKGYSSIYNMYSTDSQYQNGDGTPNLNKIKREAIGRILAENVVAKTENAKAKSWWNKILDFLKGLFGDSGNTLTSFAKAVDVILTEDLGTVRNTLLQNYEYLQDQGLDNETSTKVIALAQSNISDEELRSAIAQIVPPIVYKHSVSSPTQRVIDSVERSSSSITTDSGRNIISGKVAEDGNSKAAKTKLNPSAEHQRTQDKIDGKSNSPLHKRITSTLNKFLVDGFFDNTTTSLNEFEANIWDRLNSFPKSTKFLINTKIAHLGNVYNVDLIAITPDGTTSVFSFDEVSIEDPGNERIPMYESNAYRAVLDAQLRALKAAGVTRFGQTRVIPINRVIDKNTETITIGDVKVENEDLDYLMPIPSQRETTNIPALDSLISALANISRKIGNKPITPATKSLRAKELGAIAKAVRAIQVKRDLGPLIKQANLTQSKIESLIDRYNAEIKGLDTKSNKNKAVIQAFNQEMSLLLQIADTYKNLSSQYKNVVKLDPSLETFRDRINQASIRVREAQEDLLEVNKELQARLVTENFGIEGLLQPERGVKYFSSKFRQLSQQSTAALQSLYNMFYQANQKTQIEMDDRIEELKKMKDNFTKWMDGQGLTLRTIGKYLFKPNSNQLLDRIDRKFYDRLLQAQEEGDVTWLNGNVDTAAYNTMFNELKTKTFREMDATSYVPYDQGLDNERRDELKEEFLNTYDISRGLSKYNNLIKQFPTTTWETSDYKFITQKGNEPLRAVYEAITSRNREAAELGVLQQWQIDNFFPFVRKDWLEKVTFGGKPQLGEDALASITLNVEDIEYGKIDPATGELLRELPFYFLQDISTVGQDGKRDYSNVSRDLFHVLNMYDKQILRYRNMRDIEVVADNIGFIEKNKGALATNLFGKRIEGEEEIANTENYKLFENFVKGSIFGHRNVDSPWDFKVGTYVGNQAKKMNKLLGKQVFSEDYSNHVIPLSKIMDSANKWFTVKVLGWNIPVTISNYFGTNITALIQSGKWFTRQEFISHEFGIMAGKITGNKDIKHIALLDYFLPLVDGENMDLKSRQLNMSRINSMTVPEALMEAMAISDRPVQWAVGGAYIQNTMVVNGELVNIREHLMKTEYNDLYTPGLYTEEQRKQKRREYDEKVKQLQETKSILVTSKVVNDKIELVDENGDTIERNSDTVRKFRERMQQISRNATGMGNQEDFRQINKTMVGRSMMMFKSWIPRLMDQRFSELRYVAGTESYEMGRMRAVWGLLGKGVMKSAGRARDIIMLNDKGIEQLTEQYEQAKSEWEFQNPGKTFNMTQNEFVEMYSRLVKQGMTELSALAGFAAILLMIFSGAEDDDFESPTSKGFWVYSQRIMNKMHDELSFFYNPLEWISMANGSMFPALSVITDFTKVFKHVSQEGLGIVFDNEEMRDSAKPLKYTMKSLPITKWATPFMALFLSDENQKELGITRESELKEFKR